MNSQNCKIKKKNLKNGVMIRVFSPMKIYRWHIGTQKDDQLHHPLGNYKLKPQWYAYEEAKIEKWKK